MFDPADPLSDEFRTAVAQSAQPAAAVLGQGFDIAAYQVGEHDLAQPGEDLACAQPLFAGLQQCETHEGFQPFASRRGAQMQHRRQGFDQGIEGARIAAQEAAYHMRALGAAEGVFFFDRALAALVLRLDALAGLQAGLGAPRGFGLVAMLHAP